MQHGSSQNLARYIHRHQPSLFQNTLCKQIENYSTHRAINLTFESKDLRWESTHRFVIDTDISCQWETADDDTVATPLASCEEWRKSEN
ncbi:hypothetical protein CDAR_546351 [Caerostris darwini]|uniref:Uncharacterized protein n=1 Tax=Caerostris darwini TaxID=1538125 RepID=A0AAV4RK19_9ARAC|nr:hypothetical protein CDAR_546351 [Caerostris darwini]